MTRQQKKRPGQWITMLGFCIAMELILARFLSLHTMNLKIGLSFLPVAAAAFWGGPVAGGIVGALGDLIGATLFPVGPYFPGFTLSAFLDGAVYGLCFRRSIDKKHIFCAVAIVQLGISLCLNTFWLTVLFRTPWQAMLALRLFQCGVEFVLKCVILSLVLPILQKRGLRAA